MKQGTHIIQVNNYDCQCYKSSSHHTISVTKWVLIPGTVLYQNICYSLVCFKCILANYFGIQKLLRGKCKITVQSVYTQQTK